VKLAVIPARGGSKRIPRKNIRNFHGRPIIAYSIETALKSGCFDVVMVSTDDQEIADIAEELGAEVPFLRPPYLSNDTAGTVEVIQHAVAHYNQQGLVFEYVCCIYATAPFVTINDLLQSEELLRESPNTDYVFPVASFPYPIQRALTIDQNCRAEMLTPENALVRSQDLIETYHDAGQFYWGVANAFMEARAIVGGESKALPIPRVRAQDIDTEEDWIIAEAMYQFNLKQNEKL